MKLFILLITLLVIWLINFLNATKANKNNMQLAFKTKIRAKNNNYNSNSVRTLSSNTKKNMKIGSFRSQRSYLNEFSQVQNAIENSNKNLVNNENIEIKNYGAIYTKDNGNSFQLTNNKESKQGNKVVELHFQKTLFEKGWDKLSITTSKPANAYLQSYLAGYIEARATAVDIFNFLHNLRENTKRKRQYLQMREFFTQVVASMQHKIKNIHKIQNEDVRNWSRILLGYVQLEGLINGYTYEMKRINKYNEEKYKFTLADFLILQADGEVPELLRYFRSFGVKTKIGDKDYFRDAFGINTRDPREFWTKLMWTSKCSAFIKLVKDEQGNWSDLLVGHTTWTEYYEMLRSYKHYKFEFENNDDIPASEVTLSSYPGCLSSTDDFFITNHNLVVTETTLELIDIRVYTHVKPADKYIPNFMRVLSATRFAKTAREWCKIFAFRNSGTYSSQWMILDYNIFKKIKGTNKTAKHMVYMMEQTPKKIVYHDISHYIEKHSYFGSFNRAFLKKTKQSLDEALINNLYGNTFSYRGSARRRIVNHLAPKVTDLKSLKDVLRYNGFKKQSAFHDPSSFDPSKGISSRSDLGVFGHLSGGVDTKVTNLDLVSKMTAIAVSGPTTENNENLPVFDFAKVDPHKRIKREGVPERYSFPYVLMNPKTICCDSQNDLYTFDPK